MQAQEEVAGQLCVKNLYVLCCPVYFRAHISHVSMALQARIAKIVAREESVPLAVYTSLEHLTELDGATDEDNAHICETGTYHMSWRVGCSGPAWAPTQKCKVSELQTAHEDILHDTRGDHGVM